MNFQRYNSDDYESDPDLHTVTTLVSLKSASYIE